MKKAKIAIATISWARNAQEEALLRESLTSLAALEIPVFITDGGSGKDFLDFLSGFPHFTLLQPQTPGLWAQAQSSLQAALGFEPEFILYTEPDKGDFFRTKLAAFLAAAPDEDAVGIVVASRSATGFSSFPPFQQKTETAINQCCGEVFGQQADYTYGPFLLRPHLVNYLRQVPADIGWGWRPLVFGIAHRLHYRLLALSDDFACPADQREDTPAERLYRIRQLQQNIQGLLLSTSISL